MKLRFWLLALVLWACSPTTGRVALTPVPFTKGVTFTSNSGTTNWVNVPVSYDSTHSTPTSLLVWLHGCGGRSQYDIEMVSPGGSTQTWVSLAVGGREGACWKDRATDGSKILAAMDDVKSHFNIDPRRVVIGGYSSGGDIGYPMLFANASLFAGGIFENTGPSSEALGLAPKAAWKTNIAQISHTSDTTYPIAGIRSQMGTLKGQGFPVTFLERPGTHWDNDTSSSGTKYDLVTLGLPFMNSGWKTPAPACVYTYSDWDACSTSGRQDRLVSTSTPSPCDGVPEVTRACVYVPPVCTTFAYSAWSACAPEGKQTRLTTTSSPVGCQGGAPVLEQACVYVPPDQDGDGVEDSVDSCPSVAGIKTSDPATNGCLKLVVSTQKTVDWGTGYCRKYWFRNPNPMPMKWLAMQIRLGDGKLRGVGSVWGGIFTNPTATGTILVTPVAWTSPIKPGASIETIGFCADYGPKKTGSSSGGLTY